MPTQREAATSKVIRLTRRDHDRFLEALLEEALPNQALQAAAEVYEHDVSSGRLQTR